jgi:hypothetical protein
MNPWITQQASTARIDDLRRTAGADRLARDLEGRARGPHEHAALGPIVGELLVRVGTRLAGDDRARQLAGLCGVEAGSMRSVAAVHDPS